MTSLLSNKARAQKKRIYKKQIYFFTNPLLRALHGYIRKCKQRFMRCRRPKKEKKKNRDDITRKGSIRESYPKPSIYSCLLGKQKNR